MKKYGYLFGIAFLGVSGALLVTQAQLPSFSYAPLTGIDVLRYVVDLTVPGLPGGNDKSTPVPNVLFHTQVHVRVTEPKQEITLHADSSTLQSLRLRVDGVETLPYWEGLDLLHIPLPVAAAPDSVVHLSMDYEVAPLETADTGLSPQGLIFTRNYEGTPVLSTQNYPLYTRSWLPSHDHPSDRATFEIHLDVPADFIAAGPGRLLDGAAYDQGTPIPSDPDRRLYHWGMAREIPSYLAHFSVGRYRVHTQRLPQGFDLAIYFPVGVPAEQVAELGQRLLRQTHSDLVDFTAWLGPYPFEKLAFVFEPHPFSMEYASVIALKESSASTHELLHQWWGNTLTLQTWNDLWMSEGFTTYFSDIVRQGHPDHLCSPSPEEMKVNRPSNPDPREGYQSVYCLGSLGLNDLRQRLNHIAGVTARDDEPGSYELVRVAASQAFRCRQGRPSTTFDIVACWQSGLQAALEQHLGRPFSAAPLEQTLQEWNEHWVDESPRAPESQLAAPVPPLAPTSDAPVEKPTPDSLPSESSDPAVDSA